MINLGNPKLKKKIAHQYYELHYEQGYVKTRNEKHYPSLFAS